MTRAELVEAMAIDTLYRRGFCYYTDPMEGGQNAYDLSCEARDEAEAMLDLFKEIGMAVVPRKATAIMMIEGGAAIHVAAPHEPLSVTAAETYKVMIAASPVEARDE